MRIFADIEALKDEVGKELGVSEWVAVDQAMIDRFAEATGDFQWIHVDVARAKASPFGGTIAHGFLTLSLAPMLVAEVFEVADAGIKINYGLNRVRFPAPLPVGSRVRADVTCAAVEEVPGGLQGTFAVTFEREGGTKPVCVAELLLRYGA